MMREVKALIVALLVGILPACNGGGGPKPTPTPPPPPPDTSLLLRRDGPTFVRHSDGTPFPLQVAISCCGGGFGWPLADVAWLTKVANAGMSGVHVRPGPFLTETEAEWDIGPYAEVDGIARLHEWNPAFWNAQIEMMKEAQKRKIIVEVDLIDGWRCKRTDVPSPWDPDRNTAGLNGRATCGAVIEEVHRAWVREVVRVFGKFPNVIWQDGNEIGLVRSAEGFLVADPSYNPGWTEELRALVLELEQEFGYSIHLFGTNAPTAYGGSSDFVTSHQRRASAPINNKPTRINEYNPKLSPQELMAEICTARSVGSYFDYWRSGQTEAEMNETFQLIQAGCEPGPPPGAVCPKALAPGSRVYMNDNYYGQGLDSTVRVEGDPEFCLLIHGVAANSCNLEGWPRQTECELQLLGATVGKAQACPHWQFYTNPEDVQPCSDNRGAAMSCDHFGNTSKRDDPQTPGFEGEPVVCGQDRDQFGPRAGFFAIAHGTGYVRACRPDDQECGTWRWVDR